MNAMEKAAWLELVVSVGAVALVTALVPWLHERAVNGFGLLGLIVLTYFLVRPRRNRVVVDERDREIEKRATRIGAGVAWMTLFTALIAATMWASYSGKHAVSTRFLNWLIWLQFAICYGTKGLVGVVSYRRQQVAA
jgi:uncharacterized membrane protein